jgi:5'-nucleotidase
MSDVNPPAKLGDHRVLIVNDDGIEAHGIKMLEEIAREFTDDVWVVAPDEEKSGFSHSISMTIPIRVRKVDDRHFAVKGTPTDCALLAIYEFMGGRPPTVLLSGINRGANLAEDITYSGTAAAAMEGALLGIRSIALSQVFEIGGEVHWSTARRLSSSGCSPATGRRGASSTSTFLTPHRKRSAAHGSQVRAAGCQGPSDLFDASMSAPFPITGSS